MSWGIHRTGGQRGVGWTFGWSKEWEFKRKFSRTWSVIISVAIILVLALCLWLAGGTDDNRHLEEQLSTALDSMAQTDESQWQSLIHPTYGNHLMDLDALKTQLKKAHVVVGESWEFNGKLDFGNETYKGLDAVRITCRIRIGPTKEYAITAIYIVDEPEGFVAFDVNLAS